MWHYYEEWLHRREGHELMAIGVGLYWKPVKFGPKAVKNVALIAYACPARAHYGFKRVP